MQELLANTRRYLEAQRRGDHWEGELSSSALSTATALFTLALVQREEHRSLVQGGIRWLVRHQNPDGGWGDTVLSRSNISTTVLAWAALSVAGAEADEAVRNGEAWIARAAGSLEPGPLARAIEARYGRDRTFSVPILTMCALAGRLGKDGWRLVPGLPFELAACPPAWFRWLRLPVVSYALPALIAIGQAGHHHRPTRNPIARLARDAARGRTLEVLRSIQPQGGGFLEATPLTSFVSMSLIGCGRREHAVVKDGIDFLVRSVRPDGSWPIDTNLATWVTTLAVNAGAADELPAAERTALVNWLLRQQYREVHPYTQAAPGGWAWTDLPGGVPDADDTPGALIALHHLDPSSPKVREAAAAGITWLLDLQNRDGGMPTFCRGWGALPFDRSGADLTAHALHAWSAWRGIVDGALGSRIDRGVDRALTYLARSQRSDGAWVPLWFGNEHAATEENATYGTSRVLRTLAELPDPRAAEMGRRGVQWLHRAQNPDGGWGGDAGTPSSIEETALALTALSHWPETDRAALDRAVAWLTEHTDCGRRFDPAPIGFYFAKLWYFERLYAPIYVLGALNALRTRGS